MADSLGATYVLAGRVSEGIRGRTVGFTLYNGVTGRALMYRTLAHDSAHVMLVEQNVSTQVASQILGKLKPAEQRALDRVPDVSAKAYDLFVRGQGARDIWSFGRAADYFRQATRIARSYSPADAELALADAEVLHRGANSTLAADVLFELRSAASHAIALDSTSSVAWRAEAQSRLAQGGSRPCGGGRTSAPSRPIRATPRRSRTTGSHSFAPATPRPAARCSRARSPSSLGRAPTNRRAGEPRRADHRDASALHAARRGDRRRRAVRPAWAQRAVVRARHGPPLRLGRRRDRDAARRGSSRRSAGATVDLLARDTLRARDRLNVEWTQVKAAGAVGVLDGTSIARALLAAGESNRALDILELSMPRGPWLLAALRDPAFDSIRNDKRFRAITSGQ